MGQALVESALVLPMMIVLSLGLVQVVLYAHAHDVLVSAAEEGARLASEDGRRIEEGYARIHALVRAGLGASADPVAVDASWDAEAVAFRIDAALHPILPLPDIVRLPLHVEGRVTRERFRPAGGRA